MKNVVLKKMGETVEWKAITLLLFSRIQYPYTWVLSQDHIQFGLGDLGLLQEYGHPFIR